MLSADFEEKKIIERDSRDLFGKKETKEAQLPLFRIRLVLVINYYGDDSFEL